MYLIDVFFVIVSSSNSALIGDYHQHKPCISQAHQSLRHAVQEDDGIGISQISIIGDEGIVSI